MRSYLVKLNNIKEVKDVIEELTGSKLADDFCAKSEATLSNCIAGRVPWRPSDDSAAGAEGSGQPPARPHALVQANIRLYLAYNR